MPSTDLCYYLSHIYDEKEKCLKVSLHIFQSSLSKLLLDLMQDAVDEFLPKSQVYCTFRFFDIDKKSSKESKLGKRLRRSPSPDKHSIDKKDDSRVKSKPKDIFERLSSNK